MESRSYITIARLMTSALCVSTILVTALPFNPSRDTSNTDLDLPYDLDISLDDLDKLLRLSPPGLLEAVLLEPQTIMESPLKRSRSSSKSSSWVPKSKRFDFAFSGLDNMDHILTTLDKNDRTSGGSSSSGRDSSILRRFQMSRVSPGDFEKIRRLMMKAG